eukprot:5625411-Pyramimonas_sp.AAC.1
MTTNSEAPTRSSVVLGCARLMFERTLVDASHQSSMDDYAERGMAAIINRRCRALRRLSPGGSCTPVSYTHLRAHETGAYL